MKEVLDFLKSVNIYYLATVENDQPRVRPFATINMFEDKLYIQTGKIKSVSKQLLKNPKAEICAFKDDNWLRVSAEFIEDDRIEAKENMLENYPELQKLYSADDGNTQVFYMKNATATFCSFGKEPKIYNF